jgi:hypothetical protein
MSGGWLLEGCLSQVFNFKLGCFLPSSDFNFMNDPDSMVFN